MSSQVILSCPFCHHKAEYRDAPPGSTVRCHDCDCIFRVPAVSRRKPGSVVKGEQIRESRKRMFVWILVLLLLAGVGGAYLLLSGPGKVEVDPFKDMGLPEEGTPDGTFERFMIAWKMGDMELLLKQCATNDQAKLTEAKDKFEKFELVKYEIRGYDPQEDYYEAKVNLTVQDPRTKIKSRGEMKARLYVEKVPDENDQWHEVWRVSLQTATPRYD